MDSIVLDHQLDSAFTTSRARRMMRRGDFESRVDSICERFSRATGWQLSLYAVGTMVPSSVADELRMDLNCRWFTAIGHPGTVGHFLRLDQRRSIEPFIEFAQARELAMIIVEFIGQTSTAFDELADRTEDVMTILELTRSIPNSDDVSASLHQILQAAINLTGCFSAAFFLLSPKTDRLELRQYCGKSLGSMPFTSRELRDSPPDLKALQTGSRTIRRERNGPMNDWLPEMANIGVCRRVESTTGPIGTMWVFDRRTVVPGEMELRILESLSNQAAMTLERTVLQHESLEHGRLQREMTLASETQGIQRSVSNFESRGIEIACVTCACDTVGGDLMDVIPIEDQVVFAVGDATGHSIPAAMIMSTIRGSLRTLLTNGMCNVERPDTILRQINASYSKYSATGFYMSMLVGVIDTRTRTLRFSNAGHPLPIVFRNGDCHSHPSHGLLLGIDTEAEYGMTAVTMKPDDLLVMYTDGITEAMDAGGAMFESAGLIQAVGDARFSTADSALENIMVHFEAHAAGVYKDDHSLFVMRAGVS